MKNNIFSAIADLDISPDDFIDFLKKVYKTDRFDGVMCNVSSGYVNMNFDLIFDTDLPITTRRLIYKNFDKFSGINIGKYFNKNRSDKINNNIMEILTLETFSME